MTYININKHVIGKNNRTGSNDPAIRVARTKTAKPQYFHSVKIMGEVELIQSDKPLLPCGAKVVLFTEAEVIGTVSN